MPEPISASLTTITHNSQWFHLGFILCAMWNRVKTFEALTEYMKQGAAHCFIALCMTSPEVSVLCLFPKPKWNFTFFRGLFNLSYWQTRTAIRDSREVKAIPGHRKSRLSEVVQMSLSLATPSSSSWWIPRFPLANSGSSPWSPSRWMRSSSFTLVSELLSPP